jgi:hypothetical protein
LFRCDHDQNDANTLDADGDNDMNVRTGPPQGPKKEDLKSADGNGSREPKHSVHDEMSDTLIGIVNPPLENINDTRSIEHMKLNLILKSLMEKNGESARGASKACRIPLSTFTGYLKPNKKQVDPSHLLSIAKHYGVTIDYLFGHEQVIKFDKLPTKKIFSKWVKLTIEDVADDGDPLDLNKEGKK